MTPRRRTVLVLLLLTVAVVAVYCPWPVLKGEALLYGLDHQDLHARRMRFAQESLFGPAHRLPAWYPRELMGTPFRADLQNFPWIPTRLATVLFFSPDVAFTIGAIGSAALAAAFTFLFARRLGQSRLGAAAAGFTFACCGFYASRVLAGHLPLLEAYPALPALLWLTDRAAGASADLAAGASASWIGLSLATACFALVGHPQLTVYSLAVAACFAWVRARGIRGAGRAWLAMALGLGLAGFALYPMALLAARSTRILALGPASNDLAMPYGRLAALLFPWRDGWPRWVVREPWIPFAAYPSDAYFWDTVVYVGWAPCVAVAALAIAYLRRRIHPGRTSGFLAAVSVAALLFSLPIAQALLASLPGTILRSPARLMYVVGFGFSLALGAWLSLLADPRVPAVRRLGLVGVVLAFHAVDLTRHARAFTHAVPRAPTSVEGLDDMRRELGDGRVGIDVSLHTPYNRVLDDVGFFGALILARPYQFVLDTSDLPPTWNEQQIDGSEMSPRTLRLAGVHFVETMRERHDLVRAPATGSIMTRYLVPDPSERAALFPLERVRFKQPGEVSALLRDPGFDAVKTLLLPEGARPTGAMEGVIFAADPEAGLGATAPIVYRRSSSDEIEVDVRTDQYSWLRVLETWDPGWSATLDGAPVEVMPAHGTFLCVAVPAGSHRVHFRYRTPGAWVGIAISTSSLALGVGLGFASGRRRPRSSG